MTHNTSSIRRPGAVGALMDEYERACSTIIGRIQNLTEAEFIRPVSSGVEDDDFRSVQRVVRHVLVSGYAYADYIRTALGVAHTSPSSPLPAFADAPAAVRAMLRYMEDTLQGRWEIGDEEMMAIQVRARWETVYDLEQMLEHAIVHVLRHRRQIDYLLSLMG